MSFLIVIGALVLLMYVAYKGHSVVLFAPVAALLAVTGLTHRQSYKDIFAITLIKTSAVFVVIAFYYLTGIY